MLVQSLGYVGLRAKDIDDWSGYGTRLLGLQAVDRSRATLSAAHGRPQAAAHRQCRRRRGHRVLRLGGRRTPRRSTGSAPIWRPTASRWRAAPRSLAEERHVADLLVARDPNGNRLEFFHGAEVASDPFRPGRNISGFRTGALGLGHVVLHVERIEEMMAFYRDILGFRLSDYFLRPYRLYFLPREPAPPQHRLRRHRQECGASHDAGAATASTMSARATTSCPAKRRRRAGSR